MRFFGWLLVLALLVPVSAQATIVQRCAAYFATHDVKGGPVATEVTNFPLVRLKFPTRQTSRDAAAYFESEALYGFHRAGWSAEPNVNSLKELIGLTVIGTRTVGLYELETFAGTVVYVQTSAIFKMTYLTVRCTDGATRTIEIHNVAGPPAILFRDPQREVAPPLWHFGIPIVRKFAFTAKRRAELAEQLRGQIQNALDAVGWEDVDAATTRATLRNGLVAGVLEFENGEVESYVGVVDRLRPRFRSSRTVDASTTFRVRLTDGSYRWITGAENVMGYRDLN